MRKNKLICGLLAISALCVGAGALRLAQPNVSAQAVEGFSVNRLGYLEWNAVDGATSYQVSSTYGTFTVEENRANVGDALTQVAKANTTSTTIDFTVTPYTNDVAGTASTYTHTVEDYIDYGFSKTDLADAKNAEGAVLGASATVTTRSANAGTNGVYDAISKNDLCTFTWSTAKNLTTKEGLNEWIYLFGKDGCTWENTSNSYYVWALRLRSTGVKVYLNGTGNSAKNVAEKTTWNVLGDIFTFTGQFVKDVDYKFSVGVFDTYGLNGEKSGETIYVRLENATNQTLIAQKDMFVSNEVLTTSEVTEEDYNNASGLGICCQAAGFEATIKSGNTYDATYGAPLCKVSKLSFTQGEDKTFHWYLSNLSDLATINIENLKARITFKGQTVEQSLVETNVAGTYKISLTVPEEDYDENIAVSVALQGGKTSNLQTYTAQGCLEEIMADVNAEYGITYVLPQGVVNSASNPAVYTTARVVTLAEPETLPEGYLFKGWYETSDTLHEHKITEILGRVGEIELVAVIAQGYSVTLEIEDTTQTIKYFLGDPTIELVAPEMAGKTFKKWQIKNGSIYEDYEDASITPTANTVLKAIYDLTSYQITYVADGGTHNNPASYTIVDSLAFAPATKEGYFFAGWYKDASYLQRVENTSGYAQNLTLYAWFVKDTVGANVTITANATRQLVPMPILPEGFTCSTKLFVKDSTQALEMEDGLYYVFGDVGTVYTVEYTIMMPTGDAVVRTAQLTVVAGETENNNQAPSEEKNLPWLAIGLIGGGVLLAGAGVGVFFYFKKKRED